MTPRDGQQILKTRDDIQPLLLSSSPETSDPEKPFVRSPDQICSWVKPNEPFGSPTLRERIEPWLTALVQSEHLALLVGSGLTHAIHSIGTNGTLPGMTSAKWDSFKEEIQAEASRSAKAAGRSNGNFEDQLRAALDLHRGLQIATSLQDASSPARDRVSILRTEILNAVAEFSNSILRSEQELAAADAEAREQALSYLISFLMSFASRSGTRQRLHLFTTNYDRYLESGADAAGLRLIDRFVGSLSPMFRASRLDVDLHYNPPGIRGEPRYLEGVSRFTKLHGSIDWIESEGTIRRLGLPFGAPSIEPYLSMVEDGDYNASPLMIYPNAAKDRETAHYPYVELFRDFAVATCRPNSTLVCYGYSFGDDHINRVIGDMLTIPSAHLVVISYDDPMGRVMNTYETLGRHAQVTLLVGDHLGDLRALVDHYLPKPAIDRTTFRMADLLRGRWATEKPQDGQVSRDVTDTP